MGIFCDNFSQSNLGGPYTGVGGIGYALLRVAARLPELAAGDLINSCNDLLEYQMAYSHVIAFICTSGQIALFIRMSLEVATLDILQER